MLQSISEAIRAIAELIGKLIPGKKTKVKTIKVKEDWRNEANRKIKRPN